MKRFLMVLIAVGAIFSAAYGAFVYYDTYFPYGRMWETPAIRPHETPIPAMDKDLVPFGGGEALFKTAAGKDPASPLMRDTPETLAMGERAYGEYCVFCHGRNFDGMGTVGQSFHPLPADLKSKAVQEKSDQELFRLISYGSDRAPALATTVSTEDRWAVIYYLRSLNPGKQ